MGGMKDKLGDTPYPLYDGRPPAQKHSKTSMDAAASINHRIGPSHRQILDWLERHPEGGSDERMARELSMGLNTFRPRRRELQLMERVADSGKTELTQSRRNAVIWIRAARSG